AEGLPAPRRLRELEVPLLALGVCRRLYGTDLGRTLPPRPIQDDMICAGHARGGKDTCKVRGHLGSEGSSGVTQGHLGSP
ncbi:PRS27 protease, partial [Pomatostomus ruficeps]|nr:PRS27 protease [Pomatostomus ruficeps]